MNGFLIDWRWGTAAMSPERWLDFEMVETGKQEVSKQNDQMLGLTPIRHGKGVRAFDQIGNI